MSRSPGFPRLPWLPIAGAALLLAAVASAHLMLVVPTDIQQPGTQPLQVANLNPVSHCDNCHANYAPAVEPYFNWQGGMMSQAGRDPLFWATLAVAEQDFAGAGDLCLRCHAPAGWLAGRSEPTDGSGLAASDDNGVECDLCHSMVNPDTSEHTGVQIAPFIANDGGSPPGGYYGTGMYVLLSSGEKLGPYSDPQARHSFLQSLFHRDDDFCGTCHDVSNPLVGDLAHNNGAQVPLAPGTFSGVPGAPVASKAAFNNFPFAYGIVERTFSEHKASAIDDLLVSRYSTLPPELQAGALEETYQAAQLAGRGGDYADGTPRRYTCQSCHMRPVRGQGCNKNGVPVRDDLPLHDLTGGNYWTPEAIAYLDQGGGLRLGGGLNSTELAALDAGKARARHNLEMAAALRVVEDRVEVHNLTGHKLISGFPEGRRMWLRTSWYDAAGTLVREDGAYGAITATIGGNPVQVETLLDPSGARTRIYQAHYGLTQEWANQLLALGIPASLPIEFDRASGAVAYTLGQLGAQPPGTAHESLHFVLSNTVISDNRIPPYGFDRDEAEQRNCLPVPASQYGNPAPGGTYRHWDEFALNPPRGAVFATVELLYQPTSWEYVQFLYLANDRSVAFLANEGDKLLDAWLNTGMAAPHQMAEKAWCGLRGTGEDLVLKTEINGEQERASHCQKRALPGDVLEVSLASPGGAFNGAFAMLAMQFYPSAAPPAQIPGLNALHINDFGVSIQLPALPASGFELRFQIPSGLAGLNVRFQGICLSAAAQNGLYAISDAHDVIFQ